MAELQGSTTSMTVPGDSSEAQTQCNRQLCELPTSLYSYLSNKDRKGSSLSLMVRSSPRKGLLSEELNMAGESGIARNIHGGITKRQ